MKKWILRAGAAALLLTLAFWGYRHLFPRDDLIIGRLLEDLARRASVQVNEAPLARLMNSRKVGDFFASDLVIHLTGVASELADVRGREQLVQIVTGTRAQLQQAHIKFLDVTPVVAEDRQTAKVNLTVIADINAEKNAAVEELRFFLSKSTGHWLITRVETVKMTER